MDTSDFRDRKYLVTGAGAGIGRGLAIQLAQRGAQVWGVSKTKANLDSLKVIVNLKSLDRLKSDFRRSVLALKEFI